MINDNLKRLRIERGLTQQQVGEQLGITKQAYSYWESGQHTPRLETIMKLANIFGVTTEKITEDYAQPYDESETASFTERLISLRKEAGLTQKEIAKKLQISQPQYARTENGGRKPNGATLEKFAKFFNVSVSYLLGETSIRNFSGLTTPKEQSHAPSEQTIAERLKSARKEAGLLQKEVAEHFNITQPAYQAWESGRKNPKKETLQKLADYFDVSYAYLAGLESPLESAEILFKNKVKELGLTPEQEEQFKSSIYNFILQKGNQYNNQETSPESFAKRLKRLRKEAHLTQQDVADYFKTSPQSYAQWEKGQRSPSKESLEKLASYFGVSVSYLIGESDTIDYGAFKEQSTHAQLSDDKTFIERLREVREQSGLTQKQVAEHLDITQSAYAQWETGKLNPKKETIQKFADLFNVSYDYLWHGTSEPQTTNAIIETNSGTFPERLRQLRTEADLTQQQLADIVGTTQQNIAFWETGRQRPKQPSLIKLANYFNVSIDYLLVGKAQAEEKMSVFPERLKQLRVEAKLTQQQMAEAFDIKQPTYAQWETGRTKPKGETLEKFADFFNVSTDYLLGKTQPKKELSVFPERLRQLRIETDLTQQELAKNLNVSQQIIGLWERGERKPKIEAITNIAEYFNVSPKYLIGETNNREIETIELEAEDKLFKATIKDLDLTPEQKEEFKESIYHFILRKKALYSEDEPKESNTNKDPLSTFSKRVKELREEEGSSLEEVATKIGLDTQTYASLEGGSHALTLDALKWVSNYFDVTIAYLVGETNVRQFTDDKQEVYKVPQEEARALELDNTANTAFGERLRQVRELTGLTQIEMAIKLGTSQPAYQAWEAGRREPNLESLKKLAKVLNTSPNYLLGYNQTESIAKAIPQENAFPERLKELRKMANLTQIEMAEALNVSQPAYVEWEKGRTQPTPDKFPLIAKVLNTSIDYLLQGAPNESRLANFQGKTLGERLTFLRKNAGLTQAEVADRLRVGQNSYSNWENGVRTPIYPIIEKLADFFGVTPDSLRGKTDNVVVPKITITPNQNQETEIIDILNSKLTYNQKTLTSKDKKFFTSVIKSYFGE